MATFRETLWFKTGLTTEHDDAPSDQLRPVEDRYLDDASLTAEDRKELSLRTGQTSLVPRLDVRFREPTIPVSTLVGELKRGRRKVIAMIAASTACIAAVVVLLAS
jgi:hypothetical protein